MSETTPPVSSLQSAEPKERRERSKSSAWSRLRARMKRRPSLTVTDPHQALDLWKEEKRLGRKDDLETGLLASPSPLVGLGGVLPTGAPSDRPRLEGDPVRLQVARFVEETEGFRDWRKGLMPEDWFAALVGRRLPFRFLGPWDGLCEADVDELEAEDREAEREAEDAEKGDGRLLPGMRREE